MAELLVRVQKMRREIVTQLLVQVNNGNHIDIFLENTYKYFITAYIIYWYYHKFWFRLTLQDVRWMEGLGTEVPEVLVARNIYVDLME